MLKPFHMLPHANVLECMTLHACRTSITQVISCRNPVLHSRGWSQLASRVAACRQSDRGLLPMYAMQVVLNSLYKHTVLQSRFPVNAVALVAGSPETLSLRELLRHFLHFRVEVVRRRARCGSPHLPLWSLCRHLPKCLFLCCCVFPALSQLASWPMTACVALRSASPGGPPAGNIACKEWRVLASSLLHRYDLRRAQKRQHIVEGLLRALAELDRVVSAVRAAKDGAAASAELQAQFGLSAEQVQRLIPVV